LNQGTRSVVLGDDIAFVDMGVEFAMVDVRTPTRPTLLKRLTMNQLWIAWHQGTLYRGTEPTLVYDAASLRLLTSISPGTVDIAFVGNRALLARSSGVGLFDVSNPAAPLQLGTQASPAPIVELEASDSGLVVAIDQNGTLTQYSTAP
jgi:hypothetical protein